MRIKTEHKPLHMNPLKLSFYPEIGPDFMGAAVKEALEQRDAAAKSEKCWQHQHAAAIAERNTALQRLEAAEAMCEQLRTRLMHYEPPAGCCEHGVTEGDWCEPCNHAYKDANERWEEN